MRTTLIGLAAAALLAGGVGAQQPRPQEVELQAAIRTETVDGDLTRAIEQYQAIVAKYARDRGVTAQALLRMAGAYEKVGDAQARAIYERVLRDFSDQPAASTQARTRLAVLRPPAASEVRQLARRIANDGEVAGNSTPSPDGQYMAFSDHTGNVSLRDLRTGENRRLTEGADWGNAYSNEPVVSPDGGQVAYVWYLHVEKSAELRVVSTTTAEPPKVALRTDIDEVPYKIAWTPDGTKLHVVRESLGNTSQIGTVTIADRSFRALESLEWRSPNVLSLSPDGRYLAYDVPAGEAGSPRDVIVLATDGSRKTTVVRNPANDAFPLWTPDGAHLVFLSDRTGRNSLWAVPMANGRENGPATLLRADVGPIDLMGLTRGGTLYYAEPTPGRLNLYLASLRGPNASYPVPLTERAVDDNVGPTWSRDGQYLAYYSFRQVSADMRSGTLVIRSVQSGEERTIPLPTRVASRFGSGPKWFPDNRSVLVEVGDAEGAGFGFYRLALETGNIEHLVRLGSLVSSYDLSSDGRTIFYAVGNTAEVQQLMRFDIESRQEKELRSVVFPGGREIVSLAVSPDGGHLALILIGGFVEVMPADGGPSRELFGPDAPALSTGVLRQSLAWTPDQQWLLFTQGDNSLWKIPAAGGNAEQVGLEGVKSPTMHPDGERLVFSRPVDMLNPPTRPSVWALDNVLPQVRSSAPPSSPARDVP